MLSAGAPRPCGVEGEFVRGDRELRGDPQGAAQKIGVGGRPWHGKRRVKAIDFAVMMEPSLPQDNLPLGERLARRWLDDWRGAAVVVALLALASSITSLTNGFAYDDVQIIYENAHIHDWRTLWRVFGQPYWNFGPSTDLYRPFTLAVFGVQWAVGGGDPLVYRVVSIALYVAISWSVLTLLRVFLPARPATVGALLWAVHPVHVEAVGNVVGQAELLTAAGALLSVILYAQSRFRGQLSRATCAMILLGYPTAILSKESGIVTPVLLGVVELIGWRRGVAWHADARPRLGFLWRLLVLETVSYLVIRWAILGTGGGFPHLVFMGMSAPARVLVAMGLWPEVLRLLVWPARLYADYSPDLIPIHTTWQPVHVVSVMMAVGWVVATWRAWQSGRAGVFVGLCWGPLTYVLVSNLFVPTGILIAERTLFLPSVAVAFLAGSLFERAHGRIRARFTIPLVMLLLAAGAMRSAVRQTAWSDSFTVYSTITADAPQNGRMQVAMGQLLLRLQAVDRAGPYFERASVVHPVYAAVYAGYLQRIGRCEEAMTFVDSALVAFYRFQEGHVTRIACLLQNRRFSEARRWASEGLAQGFAAPTFTRMLLVADSLLAASDSVNSRNRWVREGRPFDRRGGGFAITRDDPVLRIPSVAYDGGVRLGGCCAPK